MNKTLDQILVDYQNYCKSTITSLNFCETIVSLFLPSSLPFLKTLFLALVSDSRSAALIHTLTAVGRCLTAWAITALAWSPGYKDKWINTCTF